MSLSCPKKFLPEYKLLSSPFEAFCKLTWAYPVGLRTTPSPARGNGLSKDSWNMPVFCLWSDYVLFLKGPHDNHTQHLRLMKNEWVEHHKSQCGFLLSIHTWPKKHWHLLLAAKKFPQRPFPVLFPLSGTRIQLVRRSAFVLLEF